MIRLKRVLGPLEGRVEFDAREVPDLAVNAIPHVPPELLFRGLPEDFHTQRDRQLQLETGPGRRNILQNRCRALLLTSPVPPMNIHHIGAQHARLRTPLVHDPLIGRLPGDL